MINPISSNVSVSQPLPLAKPSQPSAAPAHSAVPTDTVTLSSSIGKSAGIAGDVDHDGDNH